MDENDNFSQYIVQTGRLSSSKSIQGLCIGYGEYYHIIPLYHINVLFLNLSC